MNDLIIKLINENHQKIETFGIKRIGLFGSYTTNKQKPESDIAVFILVTTKKDKELAAELVGKLNKYLLPRYGNVMPESQYSE